MVCKCGTRHDGSKRHCPNCGRAVANPGSTASRKRPADLKAMASPETEQREDVVEPQRSPSGSKSKATREAPAPKPRKGETRKAEPSVFTLDASELRARIGEKPELLEPGLSVLQDSKGKPIGAGYSTDVGDIDLVARDEGGNLVVVMVADPRRDPVAEILDRMGWAAKHLAEGEQTVRGFVLLEPPTREIGYAARAVAETVSFKTYRIALTFDDVPI